MRALLKYSMRETFPKFKDLEIITISVNANILNIAYTQAVREGNQGMFTLTLIVIISRSLKLANVSLFEYFITNDIYYVW